MHRRSFLISLFFLAACASAPAQTQHEPARYPPGFQSDRIIVTAQGSGPDVILIPGLTSSSSVWDTTVSALVSTHRVHVVQVRGFAGTDAARNAEGPVSAPVAEEIARYIAENHLDHPAIIGHSMGGTIGMMLAARHPDAVGKLMVVDMFPFMGQMFGGANATPASVAPIADQIRSQMLSAPPGSANTMLEQMIATMTNTESARPTLLQHARDSNRATVANAFHELIVTDLRPELSNIRAPVTVLYVIPPSAPITREQYIGFMEMSYATLPNKRIVLIGDSYHFIMIDQFERFMSEVNAFLAPSADFPLSLAERGLGGEGRQAAAVFQDELARAPNTARVRSPLIPRPLLRKGEGESPLQKPSQHLAHPARRRQRRDARHIQRWIELRQVHAPHLRVRADPPRRLEEILRRHAARPRARCARHRRALDHVDIEIHMDHVTPRRQPRQRILRDRAKPSARHAAAVAT